MAQEARCELNSNRFSEHLRNTATTSEGIIRRRLYALQVCLDADLHINDQELAMRLYETATEYFAQMPEDDQEFCELAYDAITERRSWL